MTKCSARQHSDQMACGCGLAWDMNDPHPPACPAASDVLVKHDLADWDSFFMNLAEQTALMSKDPFRKVGAVLVTPDRRQMSLGYNGFPPEVPDLTSLLSDRAFKNEHMVHAEENCLKQAPFPTAGCTMYQTRFPCIKCAKRLHHDRVARLVSFAPDFLHPRWGESWREAYAILSGSLVLTLTYRRA